ncbi:MAG: hypothetical protein Q7V43_27410 [Myxococcales bacterium]|nr:hypothetical protein [Myxococcales bacterium]
MSPPTDTTGTLRPSHSTSTRVLQTSSKLGDATIRSSVSRSVPSALETRRMRRSRGSAGVEHHRVRGEVEARQRDGVDRSRLVICTNQQIDVAWPTGRSGRGGGGRGAVAHQRAEEGGGEEHDQRVNKGISDPSSHPFHGDVIVVGGEDNSRLPSNGIVQNEGLPGVEFGREPVPDTDVHDRAERVTFLVESGHGRR